MIFYIDADNKYKSRIDGISSLTSSDTVVIYHNGNNLAFEGKSLETLRKKFKCVCNIEVKRVASVPQSVDFAIAIDVANNSTDESLFIVGEDKHLSSIAEVVNREQVGVANSIRECVVEKFGEIDDIFDYVNFVERLFPRDKANKFIKSQIKLSLQLNKYATEIYKMMESDKCNMI